MFKVHPSLLKYWAECSAHKATAASVAAAERALGRRLPLPYVEFLTTFGEVEFGRDEAEIQQFDYQRLGLGQTERQVGTIAFLRRVEKLADAQRFSTVPDGPDDPLLPLFPADFLPVGSDAGQSQILLELGEVPGRVWFWPERDSRWGTGDNTWLGFVADDFYQFINGLKPYG